jgi:hypothetical protein
MVMFGIFDVGAIEIVGKFWKSLNRPSLTCLSPPREEAIGTRRLCSSPPCYAPPRLIAEPP